MCQASAALPRNDAKYRIAELQPMLGSQAHMALPQELCGGNHCIHNQINAQSWISHIHMLLMRKAAPSWYLPHMSSPEHTLLSQITKKTERKRKPAHSHLFPVRGWHTAPALQIKRWEGP